MRNLASHFADTTQVFPGTAAASDSFLDVDAIAQKFAMVDLPDGTYATPLWIESDGLPPNASASQVQSPLVDGPNEDGVGEFDPKTGMWIGIGLAAVALYFLIQSTRG
jgi:hypothetical protein